MPLALYRTCGRFPLSTCHAPDHNVSEVPGSHAEFIRVHDRSSKSSNPSFLISCLRHSPVRLSGKNYGASRGLHNKSGQCKPSTPHLLRIFNSTPYHQNASCICLVSFASSDGLSQSGHCLFTLFTPWVEASHTRPDSSNVCLAPHHPSVAVHNPCSPIVFVVVLCVLHTWTPASPRTSFSTHTPSHTHPTKVQYTLNQRTFQPWYPCPCPPGAPSLDAPTLICNGVSKRSSLPSTLIHAVHAWRWTCINRNRIV